MKKDLIIWICSLLILSWIGLCAYNQKKDNVPDLYAPEKKYENAEVAVRELYKGIGYKNVKILEEAEEGDQTIFFLITDPLEDRKDSEDYACLFSIGVAKKTGLYYTAVRYGNKELKKNPYGLTTVEVLLEDCKVYAKLL